MGLGFGMNEYLLIGSSIHIASYLGLALFIMIMENAYNAEERCSKSHILKPIMGLFFCLLILWPIAWSVIGCILYVGGLQHSHNQQCSDITIATVIVHLLQVCCWCSVL